MSTPEDHLAALVAGRSPGPVDPEVAAGLRARARFHGLSPLLADRARAGVVSLPDGVLAEVARDAAEARRHCAILDLELRRIAAGAPRDAGPAIVIKGPAVARRFADPSLRPYDDIDLLVPEPDLARWREPLIAMGYAPPKAWEERTARLGHHHLIYVSPGPNGRIPLELHWRLFAERRSRAVEHGVLVPHAEPDAGLGNLLVLDPPMQLVVLAVHLAHHSPATRRLMWSMDFVELGDAETVEAARELARSLGVRWALEQSLREAERVLGWPRWKARPERQRGLAAVRWAGSGGPKHRLAIARELGPVSGLRYLFGRIDPRRFRGR